MNAKSDLDLINQYLDNELKDEELLAFERRLSEDSLLNKELSLHRGVRAAVNDAEIPKLELNLKKISDEWTSKVEHEKPFWKRRVFQIAASFSLLILLSYFFVNNFGSPATPNSLYQDYYRHYAIEITRSLEMDDQKGFILYSFGSHREAIDALKSLEPGNLKADFVLGLCYLNLDQFDQANAFFQKVIDHGNNLFVDEARWYAALAYLKGNNTNAALLMLNEIDDNSSHSIEAEELVKKLQKLKGK